MGRGGQGREEEEELGPSFLMGVGGSSVGVGGPGVKLPESVPGIVAACSCGGWEENLTLLVSGWLGGSDVGACMLSPMPVPSVFLPLSRDMAVSWVSSCIGVWVCGTWMSGVGVGECSMGSGGEDEGSAAIADSWEGW